MRGEYGDALATIGYALELTPHTWGNICIALSQ